MEDQPPPSSSLSTTQHHSPQSPQAPAFKFLWISRHRFMEAVDASFDANAAARQFAQSIPEDELFWTSRRSPVPYFTYPPDSPSPIVFVKHTKDGLPAEAEMQQFAFNWLRHERQKNADCNIHVPEVYKVFRKERESAYNGIVRKFSTAFFIMEYVVGESLRQKINNIAAELKKQVPDPTDRYDIIRQILAPQLDMIAEGIRLLLCMPVPSDTAPGPYSKGGEVGVHERRTIRHLLFKDQEAHPEYSSIQELENHLNKVAEAGYRGKPNSPRVTLEKKKLHHCYTDFNDENFLFTTDPVGRLRLYIVDFEHASFLPLSFFAFSVYKTGRFYTCARLEDKFDSWLPKNNIEAMEYMNYVFDIFWYGVGLPRKEQPQASNAMNSSITS